MEASRNPKQASRPALNRFILLLLVMILAAGSYWWLQRKPATTPPLQVPVAVLPVSESPAPAASTEVTVPAFPIVAEAPDGVLLPALPELAQSDSLVGQWLEDLLGRKSVQTFLQLDGFVRRVVATADSLPREHASWTVWPVNRTPGQFTVVSGTSGSVLSADNAQRYAPFVRFVESVNTVQAVRLYVRLYPLFQQAYVDLGYPKGYFNDRLLAVIEHLLETPVLTSAPALHLVEVKGPIASLQPWVRYEFADAQLQALSAGQKMLMRTGTANQQHLRATLLAFRKEIRAHTQAGVGATRP